MKVEEVVILICYRHKNYSPSSFLHDLKEIITSVNEKCIVCGDLNIDLIRNPNVNLKQFFENLGFHNLLPSVASTTDYGTYIDLCFSNYLEANSFIYETFYSFHKGLCIYWN